MCQEPVTKFVDISVGIYNGKLNPSFISGRSYVAVIEKNCLKSERMFIDICQKIMSHDTKRGDHSEYAPKHSKEIPATP